PAPSPGRAERAGSGAAVLDGPNTALARALHARGLLDVATLQAALEQVRAGRAREPGLTLARWLDGRGLVDPATLAELEGAWREPGRFGPYRVERLLGRGG